MVHRIELFDINSDLSLVAEISELQHDTNFRIQTRIDIQNQDETVETYELCKVDRSGGDIAGWNYVCKTSGRKLLIIND